MSLAYKQSPSETHAVSIERLRPPVFPANAPLSYIAHAVIAPAADGTLGVVPGPAPERGLEAGGLTYLIKDPMARHYVHFLETIIWIYAVRGEFFPELAVETLIFEGVEARDLGPGSPQRQILDILFATAAVIPAERYQGGEARHCVVIERARDRSPINKFCEPSLGFSWKWVPRLQSEILRGHAVSRQAGGGVAAPHLYPARVAAPFACAPRRAAVTYPRSLWRDRTG
jgi:hypothetical protein